AQQEELQSLLRSCRTDLRDLQRRLTDHKSLKGSDPRTLDRLTFTTGRRDEMKIKLIRHGEKLNLFLTQLHTGSLARIEQNEERTILQLGDIRAELRARLIALHEDVRAGRKDPSLLTDIRNWDSLEKELIDDNITEVDVEDNKDAICDWLAELQAASDSDD
ncbi:hypothetical protein BDV95DRAFT_462761, partial [Massariosphaeria phaeospora]